MSLPPPPSVITERKDKLADFVSRGLTVAQAALRMGGQAPRQLLCADRHRAEAREPLPVRNTAGDGPREVIA